MKKVLLTTTALVMTAGVASAEITFSGTGEAGVYRTAPTAAVAAVAGRDTNMNGVTAPTAADSDSIVDTFAATDLVTTQTATSTTAADADELEYLNGVLTLNKAATNTSAASAVTAAELEAAAQAARDAAANVAAATTTYNTSATSTAGKTNLDALNLAKAAQALADAYYANLKGTAAVAKGATPKLKAYSGYDLDVAVSAASDNGMTFAMAFDMGAGSIADQDDDRAMDAQAGAIATSAATIGYAGYTFRVGDDKLDDLYDDSQNGDIGISGSLGDLTFSLVTDMDDDVKEVKASTKYTAPSAANAGDSTFVVTEAVAAVYNPTSYSIGYTMGDVAFSMAGTEHDDRGHSAAKMSLTYTVSDALSATLSSDNVGTYKDIAKVSITSKISDAISITASVKDDKDHALNTNTGGKQSQDVSIAYSAGALSSTLATDEGSNWWVNAKYDLGGGASAFTTFDHTEFLVAGVNFKF